MVLQINAQVIAVDEYCISNSFAQNGTMNDRPLYGPIAGIYIFWDDTEEWVMGSLDKNYVYYTSQDNSTGPGCSSTFTWTAPANSECENIAVSGETCSIIVPVEYVYLKGKKEQGNNLITWKTASEINNEGFVVERSTDGISFSKIGFVNGKGTTSFSYDYAFVDRSLNTSISYFYRLVQRDYDGHSETSKIIQITGSREGKTIEYASMAMSNILLFSNFKRSNVSLELFDMNGKKLYANSVALLQGENALNIPDVPSGQYILSVEMEHNELELYKLSKI
ncbi:T9SS type A sorting domain-containing protein [Portibacter lacus]|nr:T9SS type A sorting domain-containing protein [Portibacter lacus]